MKKKAFILTLLFPALFVAQVSSFSFNINGAVPTGFAQALSIAGQKWSNHLTILVPVKVNVFTVNSSFLPFSAITLANGRKNFPSAPVPNTLYVSTLANQIAGTELNPGQYDMDIYFNLATPFYYGTGNPPATSIDFISTAMHEIGHGLGFYSDGYVDGAGKGSFGNIPPSAIAPLTTSFPWRGQDSVPSIYDKYIVRASQNLLINSAAGNSTALGDSIKNGALYFSGPVFANPSHANAPVRLAGGTGTFSLGEDLLHIHSSYPNTIMSYYWGSGDTVRTPAPWEIGILKEIGWNLVITGLVKHPVTPSQVNCYPNPASTEVTVIGKNMKEVRLYQFTSDCIKTRSRLFDEGQVLLDVSDLSEGIYFLKIAFTSGEADQVKKIIIRH